jgi:hypothetical protein
MFFKTKLSNAWTELKLCQCREARLYLLGRASRSTFNRSISVRPVIQIRFPPRYTMMFSHEKKESKCYCCIFTFMTFLMVSYTYVQSLSQCVSCWGRCGTSPSIKQSISNADIIWWVKTIFTSWKGRERWEKETPCVCNRFSLQYTYWLDILPCTSFSPPSMQNHQPFECLNKVQYVHKVIVFVIIF